MTSLTLPSGAASFGSLGGAVADNAALVAALALKLDKAGGAFTGLTGAGFRDTSAAFDVTQTFTSSTALDAARSITWDVKNASHQLKFTAASIVTFPSGTNTLLGSAVANTITTNGAASTPALLGSGTIFTGGSATTTKPYWLIEPTGTTSTGWSTNGTLFGGNAPSGFVGNLFDYQINGASKIKYDASAGRLFVAVLSTNHGALFGNNFAILGALGVALRSDLQYLFASSTDPTASWDAGIARVSSANIKLTNGSTGYGTLDAAGFKVGGVAGTSGTITAASTVTVVNGIVTVIA